MHGTMHGNQSRDFFLEETGMGPPALVMFAGSLASEECNSSWRVAQFSLENYNRM